MPFELVLVPSQFIKFLWIHTRIHISCGKIYHFKSRKHESKTTKKVLLSTHFFLLLPAKYAICCVRTYSMCSYLFHTPSKVIHIWWTEHTLHRYEFTMNGIEFMSTHTHSFRFVWRYMHVCVCAVKRTHSVRNEFVEFKISNSW